MSPSAEGPRAGRVRSRRWVVAAALAAVTASPGAAQMPAGGEVVARYVAAIGGEETLRRIEARHMVMEMALPMGGSIRMETFHARPALLLARVDAGDGEMLRGFDGNVAWVHVAGQPPSVLEGEELAEVLRQADFDASHYLPGSFSTLETLGEEIVAGRACWQVRMVHRSGSESKNCFDRETGLLLGFSIRRESAAGPAEVASRVEDYREFDGMRMPTRLITEVMGMEMVTTVRSVSHAPIDPAVFQAPPGLASGN